MQIKKADMLKANMNKLYKAPKVNLAILRMS